MEIPISLKTIFMYVEMSPHSTNAVMQTICCFVDLNHDEKGYMPHYLYDMAILHYLVTK